MSNISRDFQDFKHYYHLGSGILDIDDDEEDEDRQSKNFNIDSNSQEQTQMQNLSQELEEARRRSSISQESLSKQSSSSIKSSSSSTPTSIQTTDLTKDNSKNNLFVNSLYEMNDPVELVIRSEPINDKTGGWKTPHGLPTNHRIVMQKAMEGKLNQRDLLQCGKSCCVIS